jgi:hypothetical protein
MMVSYMRSSGSGTPFPNDYPTFEAFRIEIFDINPSKHNLQWSMNEVMTGFENLKV